MKIFISILFAFAANTTWCQIKASDTTAQAMQAFWSDNIAAMINLNKEKIISQTYFPLGGEWYQQFELWEASDAELKAAYCAKIENVFDQRVRDGLTRLTWKDAKVKQLDGEPVLSVIYDRIEEEYGNLIYFQYELVFKKIKDRWLLTSFNFIG